MGSGLISECCILLSRCLNSFILYKLKNTHKRLLNGFETSKRRHNQDTHLTTEFLNGVDKQINDLVSHFHLVKYKQTCVLKCKQTIPMIAGRR